MAFKLKKASKWLRQWSFSTGVNSYCTISKNLKVGKLVILKASLSWSQKMHKSSWLTTRNTEQISARQSWQVASTLASPKIGCIRLDSTWLRKMPSKATSATSLTSSLRCLHHDTCTKASSRKARLDRGLSSWPVEKQALAPGRTHSGHSTCSPTSKLDWKEQRLMVLQKLSRQSGRCALLCNPIGLTLRWSACETTSTRTVELVAVDKESKATIQSCLRQLWKSIRFRQTHGRLLRLTRLRVSQPSLGARWVQTQHRSP